MKITTVRNETLPSGATVSSFESTTEPGQMVVQVIDHGIEISELAPTRGEAMVELAEYLLNLSREIRKAAFEQEGAIGPGVLEPRERRAVDF